MAKKKLKPNRYPLAIQFSERFRRTDLWIAKGEELLTAAKILEADLKPKWSKVRVKKNKVVSAATGLDVQSVYSMLIAYSIENFCKVLLIHRNRESLKNRLLTKIPNYIKEHDLQKLVNAIQLKLSVHEQELLTRLSRNSIWAARYPVPTEPNGIQTIEQFSNGRNYLTAYFGPRDFDRIQRFLDRLRKYVQAELNSTV